MPDARSGRTCLGDSVSKHAERQASPFSGGKILEHLLVQRQVCHQSLQPSVLFLVGGLGLAATGLAAGTGAVSVVATIFSAPAVGALSVGSGVG